ncbi:MAG: Hsp70 family protein [Lentisphaeria bacterium]|nr:Hsp70 family protein [Lentisphaeria bacterium]
MPNESRYIVGIDLGTTNTALAYVDTSTGGRDRQVSVFPVPQLTAPGEVSDLPVLPSFVYLPGPGEVLPETLRLPWQEETPDVAVGAYARDMAALRPARVVASAKSWLCYEGIDRRTDCLPFSREDVPRRISPVEAARLCLVHLRDAWNCRMAADREEHRLERQTVLLTVPASFDAVARELTVEAATRAGLQVRLIEEPQAAFYAWLHHRGETWRKEVSDGDVVLVCDVGGGTTDFSLIAVADQGGELGLQRLAVGEHILLGGDNMDLALAYAMAAKLRREKGIDVDAYQLAALTHACRAAKERLAAGEEQPQTLAILGRGSGVVGGTVTVELTAAELRELLIDGFFPVCGLTDKPGERRRAGLRTFGLDYAADPAITRHLAAFIDAHSFRDGAGNPMLPTAILFNGGVTKSAVLQERVLEVVGEWNAGSASRVTVLEQADADLSVAQGAAWYGSVQRSGGVRIRAGSARSYYIGVESSLPAVPGFAPPVEAVCVVGFGLEEGSTVDVPAEGIGLVVGEPTEFRFFSSTVRPDDAIGAVLTSWREGELTEMPPLVAELPVEEGRAAPIGTLVPVRLRTVLTEIGTLQLWCDDVRSESTWKLEFELRGNDPATQPGNAA